MPNTPSQYSIIHEWMNCFIKRWSHADLPEPEDLLAAACIVPVDGVPLPVHQVYLLHATQHHLVGDGPGGRGTDRDRYYITPYSKWGRAVHSGRVSFYPEFWTQSTRSTPACYTATPGGGTGYHFGRILFFNPLLWWMTTAGFQIDPENQQSRAEALDTSVQDISTRKERFKYWR